MITETETIIVDYDKIHKMSLKLINSMREETVDNGQLAALLTAGRLQDPSYRLPKEREITFIQDGMAWLQTYFSVDSDAEFH